MESMTATEAAIQAAEAKLREDAFRRAPRYGGVGWPWRDKPGFALVLARQGNEARILYEAETGDIGQLYEWCRDKRSEFRVLEWFTDMDQPGLAKWREASERDAGGGRWDLLPGPAPLAGHPDELAAYLLEVRQGTTNGVKTLYFGESALSGLLRRFSTEDMGKAAREFPPVAALGYALTGSAMAARRIGRGIGEARQEGWAAWI